MDYKTQVKELGLKESDVDLIDEKFSLYSQSKALDLKKIIVALESKKAQLPALFNTSIIAIILAFLMPVIMDFIILDTDLRFIAGCLFIIYILGTALFVKQKFDEYSHQMKEISVRLEVCKALLESKKEQ